MSEFDELPDNGTESLRKTRKADTAFRTISEVADELHIPQHVLRFWETKFPQVRPLKRGGGRRYYRPDDVLLLRRVSELLYTQGYTIKGVQRLLREGGGRLENVPVPVSDDIDLAQLTDAELDALDGVPSGMSPEETSAFEAAQERPHEVARLREAMRETLERLKAIRAALP